MTEEKPKSTFELVIRSRTGAEEIRRKVTLWADLSVFSKLKNDPEQPVDILSDTGAIEKVAADPGLQVRLFYLMSDAQDLTKDVFESGLTEENIGEALSALRGALVGFFLARGSYEMAQALVTNFEGSIAVRKHLAQTIRESMVAERVIESMKKMNIQGLIDDVIDENQNEMKQAIRTPG